MAKNKGGVRWEDMERLQRMENSRSRFYYKDVGQRSLTKATVEATMDAKNKIEVEGP